MPQGVELVGFCEMTNVAPVIYAWHEFITSRFGWPPDCPVNDGRLGQSGKAAFAPDRLQLARQITPFTYSYRLLHDQPLLPIAPPASGATARSHQPPVTYKRDNVHCRQIVPLGSSWIRSSRQFLRNFVSIQVSNSYLDSSVQYSGSLAAEDFDAGPLSATRCSPHPMLVHRHWSQRGTDGDARCITAE